MSTVYNGSAPGGANPNAPAITIPADGDARNAASVNASLQKLADYIANLGQNTAPPQLTFVANPGNAASTTYFAWAATSQAAVAANGTVRANGQTTHMAGSAAKVRGLLIKTGQLTVGGSINVVVGVNGNISVAGQPTALIAAGTAASTLVVAATNLPSTIAAGDVLEIAIVNGVGVTAGIGLSLVTVLLGN